jgi:2,4-dienoyl-CoA reductase-like NADH-dependent reductase (Old Yellow Enzyme family)/thioredoxin reductase
VPDPFEVLAAPGKYWKDHAAMPGSFEHLLSPLQVGPKLLRNRVLISAHVPRLAVDNLPGAAYIAYHRVRARGGAGLQITGATAVHPTGTLGTPNSLENLDDRIVPGYRQLADAVHGEGGTILAQLAHSAATLNVSDAGRPLWAPSPVQSELARETPHEMTRDDIAEMIAAYRAAALRVREGGLDGIELLAAFGFLIAAFLSPLTNKREDAYGGSPDKRLRFALEVVSAVREAIGPEQILGMRIPGEEGVAGGLTRDDMRTIAVRLAETGRLDYLNVIVGTNYSRMQRMAHWGPTPLAHGVYVPLAANIKSAVGIPVFAAGRITEPKLADAIIRDGKADMVAMTRAHIADPDIVRKIREGRAGEVRPCVGANVCISLTGGPLRCFHNPFATRDLIERPVSRTTRARSVVVVGGGIAGLEAARVAARRGHKVRLYEASDRLGGRLALWSRSPLTGEFEKAVAWRLSQLESLQVRRTTGRRIEGDELRSLNADVLIIATGSRPGASDPPAGAQSSTIRIVSPDDVLESPEDYTSHTVVRDGGGGRTALSAAEALAAQGVPVTVVTSDFVVGEGIDPVVRTTIHAHLLRNGAVFRAGETIERLEGAKVLLINQFSQRRSAIEGVAALVDWHGRRAEDTLLAPARDTGAEVHIVGDALAPRSVHVAVAEAAAIAERI